MPEDDRTAAESDPAASSGEFNFALPAGESRRVRKRSLKPKTQVLKPITPDESSAAATRGDLEREAPPRPVESSQPERPASTGQPQFASTARPSGNATAAASPSSSQAASPHATRPATLYYSSGKEKIKETVPPMKTTTTTTASSSATASPVSSAAPSSSATRPATVLDYRSNMERQAREQRSMGNLLSIIVYVLIGFFVLSSFLAGYGIFALSKQIKKQSLTIDELDKHYAAETQQLAADNQKLNTQLQSTMDTLTQAQAQIGRQQSLILQQQETLNKLSAQTEATAAALRQERATRADTEAELRDRIRSLEYHGPTTQRY